MPRLRLYYKPGHPRANERGFVEESELGDYRVEESLAINSGIMVDRFYEGLRATDGTDIGSRQKHRAYMREHGLTTADDFRKEWSPEEKQKRESAHERSERNDRREALGRAVYEASKKGKR